MNAGMHWLDGRMPMSDNSLRNDSRKDIWVLAEHMDGELEDVCLEVLSEGRRLSKLLGEEMAVVAIGGGTPLCERLRDQGVGRVYLINHELLDCYNSDSYTQALSGLVAQYRPRVLLCSTSQVSRDFIPRVAARTGASLASHCTNIRLDEQKRLLVRRPVFGGKLEATVTYLSSEPCFVMMSRGLGKPDEPTPAQNMEVVEVKAEIEAIRIRMQNLGRVRGDPRTLSLEEAEIIVSGGKGVNSREGFQILEQLADCLGGCVGASRMAVDAGWVSSEKQVGLTGKTVSPRLYVACGISGAVHHTMGMKDSRRIVSINTDRNAPLAKIADVSIVGDLGKVVPAIVDELKKRKQTAVRRQECR